MSPPGPELPKTLVVATYVDHTIAVRRVLICDLALANSMGAAMSMIPAGVARDATKSGNIGEHILGNLREILNICVNLFTGRFADRLTFSELRVCAPGDPLPTVTASVTYALNIPRYPGGNLLAGSV